MLEPEQFDALLAQLKETVREELKKEERLWDLKDLSDYFKASKQVVGRYRKRPDFPRSRAFVYEKEGKTLCTQRWVPKEVKEWALRQRVA
jgi:hypothetical protein